MYFDQPEGSEWLYRYDVLQITREHRRILNVQPRMLEVYHLADYDDHVLAIPDSRMIHDFKTLSN